MGIRRRISAEGFLFPYPWHRPKGVAQSSSKMSPCPSCNEPIAPDAHIMHMPCCSAVGHTICMLHAIKIEQAGYSNMTNFFCSLCDAHIHSFTPPTYYPLPSPQGQSQEMPTLTPALRAAIKDAKKAVAAKKKALRTFKSSLRTISVAFKIQTSPLIASLISMKKEAGFTASHSPAALEFMRMKRQATAKTNRLVKIFGLTWWDLRTLGIRGRRVYSWKESVTGLIQHSLRLRSRFH